MDGMNSEQLRGRLKITSQVKSLKMVKKYVTFMEITWDTWISMVSDTMIQEKSQDSIYP